MKRLNPFSSSINSEELAKIIVSLLPTSPEMSEEEKAELKKRQEADAARYEEARYGALPPNTYRILDQGGFIGWHYELEIDGEEIILEEPDVKGGGMYAVHADPARAVRIARSIIAKRRGEEVAKEARFRVIWGGQL